MKILFLTCIYGNLYGSEFGGRPSRFEQYKFSLLSLLRMSDADFVCYTSFEEKKVLEDFFYNQNKIPKNRLEFVVFDLKSTKHFDVISKFKDVESVRKGDRCFEIQYNKFFWLLQNKFDYDYCFWIDAGISHTGILPDKHLINNHSYQRYFNSNLFDNKFLSNLIDKSKDKLFLIGKSNIGSNYWSNTIPSKFYKNYDSSLHIIGGLFGGKQERLKELVTEFERLFLVVTNAEHKLYSEEQFMSLIFSDNNNLFNLHSFDVWLHEDNLTSDYPINYLELNKSFYKILEEITQ